MFFTNLITVLALATSTIAASFTVRTSTKTVLQCGTIYGAKSVAPPLKTTVTTKTILFLPLIGTSVFTPTSTVTPPPITTTSTTQATTTVTTTDSTVTSTFSSTSTIITTETNTEVVTSTSTTTDSILVSSTTTTTSTVPTSPGFLPIESTTATAYPNSPSRRFRARSQISPRGSPDGILKSSYPQSVRCFNLVELLATIIYVRTTTAKTTTVVPATSTATSTVTTTSTSTVVPPSVSITSSFSTTVTARTTTTSTSLSITTTSTTSTLIITSTSSIYAACTSTSKNILGPQTPNGLIEAITDTNRFEFSQESSSYDCCVKCQLSNTCAGTFYSVGSQDPEPARCLQVQSTQCSSQAGFSRGYLTNPRDNGFTYVASNGNCGYLYYGGQF